MKAGVESGDRSTHLQLGAHCRNEAVFQQDIRWKGAVCIDDRPTLRSVV